jgi:hypothetical protein
LLYKIEGRRLPIAGKLIEEDLFAQVKVKDKITIRLVVYHQSVRLGTKPLETHDHNFYFPTDHLRL